MINQVLKKNDAIKKIPDAIEFKKQNIILR